MDEKIIIYIISTIILYGITYFIIKFINLALSGKDVELRFNIGISAFILMIPFFIPWSYVMFIETMYVYLQNKSTIFYIILVTAYLLIILSSFKLLFVKKTRVYKINKYSDESLATYYLIKYPSETLIAIFKLPIKIKPLINLQRYNYIKTKEIPIGIFTILISPMIIGVFVSFYIIEKFFYSNLLEDILLINPIILLILYYVIFIVISILFNNILFCMINLIEEVIKRILKKNIYFPSIIKYVIYVCIFTLILDFILYKLILIL